MSSVDQVIPEGKWEFDSEVTDAFDDMLERSIPEYETMRRAVFEVGTRYVRPKTSIVDLGCSRGEALYPFVRKFGAHNRYVGCEVSQPMLEAARQRFVGWEAATTWDSRSLVDIREVDLRREYPGERSSLTLSVLTLQFTPIEYRQQIVRRVHESLVEGGAFVLVEKVMGASAGIDDTFVDAYLNLKRENGYTEEQIQRKRLALEGVLVPVTARWNEELLRGAGFSEVDCFWRWMNFAGWVAVK